jgi:hypothetical protein
MLAQSHRSEAKESKQSRNSMAMTVFAPAVAANHYDVIAKMAYYAAERRGFTPGFELDDWLTAEREVEKMPPRKE